MDFATKTSAPANCEAKAMLNFSSGIPPVKRVKVDPTEMQDAAVARKNDNTGWQEEIPALKDRHAFLINNELMSDFTFIMGDTGTSVFAHKFVLASASSYFQNIFYGPEPYNDDKMLIAANYKLQSFLSFIKYVYTNDFESDMSAIQAHEVGLISRRFSVPGLEAKCADLLMASIDCSTVFWVYGKATAMAMNADLAATCLRFIDGHIKQIIATDAFWKVDAATLNKILKRNTLRVEEPILFKALLRWSEEQCRRSGKKPTAENKRSTLGENFHLIRFPAMESHAFAEDTPHDLFTEDEVISIYKYLCAKNKNECDVAYPTKIRSFPLSSTYQVDRYLDCATVEFDVYPDGRLYDSYLRFTCDKLIFLPTIGVHGVSSKTPGMKFSVTVKVLKESRRPGEGPTPLKSQTVDFKMSTKLNLNAPTKFRFDSPVGIVPHCVHGLQVTARISGHGNDPPLLCRQGLHPEKNVTVQCDQTTVTINFFDYWNEDSVWQVPMLLFHL